MRGHIKQRSPGSWTLVYDLPPDGTGRRKQKSETVRGTKAAAQKVLRERLAALDAGTYVPPKKETLAAYLENWVRDYAYPNLAPKTAQNYAHMVEKHIAPGLGQYILQQLRPEHIQKYIAEKLAAGLSAKTVRHHYVTLHTALGHAVRHGTLARNPCDSVTPAQAAVPGNAGAG